MATESAEHLFIPETAVIQIGNFQRKRFGGRGAVQRCE
ncbi:hypothetical protein C7S14_8165 [Burkholderia cepacia]|nr:hypothetical protein C7S14_8165 [Burkholderia cepacia]